MNSHHKTQEYIKGKSPPQEVSFIYLIEKKVKLIFSFRRPQYFTVEPIHNGHLGDRTKRPL